jgi:hypothetical protein
MARKYVVDLTDQERASLQQLLQSGSNRARRPLCLS